MYYYRQQLGFSIIEIMVGMVLSLFLIAGVTSFYFSNKESFNTQNNIARIEADARFISEMLQADLRHAGYYGCNKETPMKEVLNSTPFLVEYANPIEGYDAEDTTTWDRAITETGLTIGTTSGDIVRGGTDILVVRRAEEEQTPLASAMASSAANLEVEEDISPALFAVNDVAIVSDCSRSAIFQVTAFNESTGVVEHSTSGGSIGNDTSDLLDEPPFFNTDASVMKFRTTVYFIGTDTNGVPSLRRKVNGEASEVIASGVENMQILYGLDTDASADGVANRYVTAEDVSSGDWENVVSTRVGLLMQSPGDVLPDDDDASYFVLDEEISDTGTTITHAGDRLLRQVVPLTIDLRNI